MKKLYLFLILNIFIIILPLFAQNQKTDTLQSKTKEVVVTGLRYEEDIMEIPMSVSLIVQKDIQNSKGYGFDNAFQNIPGILVQSRNGNQDVRLTIRGFGARGAGDKSNAGTSRGVKVFVDGIPETEPDGRTSFDNIDMSLAEKIEVIRSNASALWGNAAGGIVNIFTVPMISKPFVSLDAFSGSYGFRKYVLKTGTRIGNSIFSAGFTHSAADGWRGNSNSERNLINISLMSPLSGHSMLGVYISGVSNLFYIPGPLTQQQYDSMPDMANPLYLTRKERRDNKIGRIGVTLDNALDENNSLSGMLFLSSKYLKRSERNTYRDFTRFHLGGNLVYKNVYSFTERIRNTFLGGMDEQYQDGAILFYSLTSTGGRGDALKDNKKEGASSFGAFIQDEVIISEQLSLIFGLRHDIVSYFNESFMVAGIKETEDFAHTTPKFGASYKLSENSFIFTNIGGGVEVPAGNETDPAPTFGQDTVYMINPLLKPIVSQTYEIGSKNIFSFESILNEISVSAAGYYILTNNEIVPYSGGKYYFTAGKTSRLGLELAIRAKMDYGLSLQGAFTYCQGKYLEYKIDSVHYNKPGAYADYKDNKIAGIPDIFFNGQIKWKPEFAYGAYIDYSFSSVGKYFVDDANYISIPEYMIMNLTFGMDEPLMIIGSLGFRGFISLNNLADIKYAPSAYINPDRDVSGNPVFIESGAPRNIAGKMQISF